MKSTIRIDLKGYNGLIYIMFFTVQIILFNLSVNAENITVNQDYFTKEHQRNNNYIYSDDIHTVILNKDGFEMSDPIIKLNSSEKLLLSFDDFSDDVISYKYTVQLCDADWKDAELDMSRFIDGFTEDLIEDYSFSLNTTQPYIHYELVFPTNYLRITKSGNYIIKVYDTEVSDDNLVFNWRFKVLDQKVFVDAKVKQPQNIVDIKTKQEIGFTINLDNFYIANPDDDLKVVIQQNGREDNIIRDIPIMSNNGTVLDYHFNEKSVFDGGGEFRSFDLKSLKYNSERVKTIDFHTDGYHIQLWPDKDRSRLDYIFNHDINGRKLISNEDYNDATIESDYCQVHFTLPYNDPFVNGKFYIIGELSNWQFSDLNKMIYNYEKKAFESTLFIKQGYYNYQYIFLENDMNIGDVSNIEGNHFDTENEYSIFIYYREPGGLYDQLISFNRIASH